MQLPALVYGLLTYFVAQAFATALTYKLEANEKACFYTGTKNKAEKIAFYFAVRFHLLSLSGAPTVFPVLLKRSSCKS